MSIEETICADEMDNKIKIIVSDVNQTKMLKSITSNEAGSRKANLTKNSSRNSKVSLGRIKKLVSSKSKNLGGLYSK